MTILRDVLAELVAMFVSDARLTVAILALVMLAAVLIDVAGVAPVAGGAILLAGCLVLIVGSVWRAGRRFGRDE